MNKLMISVLLCSFITSAWAGTAYITEPASKITAGSTLLTSGSGTTILEDMGFTLASSHSSPRKSEVGDVEVYYILDNENVHRVCPVQCKDAGGIWNGQWANKYPVGLCGCRFPYRPPTNRKSVDVREQRGVFIGNQHHARGICPSSCKNNGGRTWNGQWKNDDYSAICGCYE